MAGLLVGTGSFEPLNQVSPFTYRDGSTYLSQLNGMKATLDNLIGAFTALDENNAAEHNEISETLTSQFNAALDELRTELVKMLDDLQDSPFAFDPTTGQRNTGLSTAISNVYDNVRIFAYFAKQYDSLNLTAAQYDALQHSARHFDLAVTHPTLNDVNPTP